MSDLEKSYTEFTNSLRWNAEAGILSVSIYDLEAGGRELKEILLGAPATFVLDLATRERGYGLIRVGVFDMRLSPVGAPLPPRPTDDGYKGAIGCWLWNPEFGELRLEATATLFCQAIKPSSTESHFPQIRCALGFGNLPIRLGGEWRGKWSFGRNRVKRVFLNILKPWRQFWAARIGRGHSRIIALAC